MVLSRLVHESDAVLMDLRGFSRGNAGCVFELQELARLVPLDASCSSSIDAPMKRCWPRRSATAALASIDSAR